MLRCTLLIAWSFVCWAPRATFAETADAKGASGEDAGAEEVAIERRLYPEARTFELGGFLGVFIPSDEHEFYDTSEGGQHAPFRAAGVDLGLRAAYVPLKNLALETELAWIPIGTENGDGATLLAVRGHLLIQIPDLRPRLTPFAVAGLALVPSYSDALGDDIDGGGYLGVGAKYYLSSGLLMRGDLRWARMPEHRPQGPDGTDVNHFEVLVGASWTLGRTMKPPKLPPQPDPDPDRDGFMWRGDECPDIAGVAPNGCPVGDSDDDGLKDDVDECPGEPETVNGYKDDDGCPDEQPDTDGDGLTDDTDGCVDQPEDIDGYEDTEGCPDPDNDGDGVLDVKDGCPLEAGPAENRGCPDADRDGDGVVDRLDNCPDEPGRAANHGCKKKQLVVLTQTQIKILDRVYFRTGRARIRRRSFRLLDNVASVLLAHPEIEKVSVEGHTDDRGKDDYNKELSQRRAEAVVAYLVRKGVASERLVPTGFGEEKPIGDNQTRRGRADNRRVEFNIVPQ